MKIIILALIAILITIQSSRLIHSSGLGITIDPVNLPHCQAIEGPVGAEDITIDAYNQIAYIGADDRRLYLVEGQPTQENGAIWMLDLSQPDSQAVKINTDITGVFHPHGITLRKGANGEALELYVVNHIDASHHEIDIFEISKPGVLTLRRRVSYPEMISPNDLVVVAKDKFFVTNDHGYPHGSLMQKVEEYLGLPMSSVSYFDGEKGQFVIEGLKMANGIALSSDQKTLYVAETLARQVSRYTQLDSALAWQYQDSVGLEFGVDNLEWSDEGKLLTGGHPKVFDFLAHLNDRKNLAASEVASIDVSGKEMLAETIYRNAGEELSGSSVAAQLGATLLVGPVIDEHFLRCQVN